MECLKECVLQTSSWASGGFSGDIGCKTMSRYYVLLVQRINWQLLVVRSQPLSCWTKTEHVVLRLF